jgi:hypothetical protein
MRVKLLLLAMLALPVFAGAQSYDRQKIDSFAAAVAHAEGFNARHRNIPSRYHNPGDIKSRPNYTKLPGQKSIGKGGHIVFKNDAAGWSALRDQIAKMLDGRSKHFTPSMTVAQIGKHYAANWRPWVKIVTRELGVSPDITLAAYFDVPPAITVVPDPNVLIAVLQHDAPIPVLGVSDSERLVDSMTLGWMYQNDQQNPQRHLSVI